MMKHYTQFNFDAVKTHPLEKRRPGNPGHSFDFNYISGIHTLDIEASPVEIDGHKHALIYLWQFKFDGTTYYGRRIEQLQKFMEDLCVSIPDGRKIVLWIHFLGYEFQHIRDLFCFNDVFMRSNRQPIRATIENKIELRCSYALSNCSLDQFAKNMGVSNKRSSTEYNHNIHRTPDTVLTDNDMLYGEYDCISLAEAVERKMQLCDDNLYTVPWTSSGYDRRDIRRALHDKQRFISSLKPSYDLYNMMQQAFRGGLCDSNSSYSDVVIDDVVSFDKTSSYIESILCKKYPMRKFTKYDIKTNGQPDIKRWKQLDRCWISKVVIYDINAKNKNIRYLDNAKCECNNYKEVYGKITEADILETTITDIDYENIVKCYNFKKIVFTETYYSTYDMLPIELRNLVLSYFTDKTKLKNTGLDAEYNLSKERLNTVYGIMVQNILRDQIEYDPEDCSYSTTHKDNEETYKKTKMLLPYQWGVWTTAHARTALIDAMLIVGSQLLYNDTDSVKFRRSDDIIASIQKLNEKIKAVAIENNALAVDSQGNTHYVGLWLLDAEYKKFKTLAPKMYVGQTDDGIKITISGVDKKAGSLAITDIDEITYGYTFPENCSHYTEYNDLEKPIEYNGYKIYSNMVIHNYAFTITEND